MTGTLQKLYRVIDSAVEDHEPIQITGKRGNAVLVAEAVWRDPFVDLRTPKLFHLRRDPFERADTDSNQYNHWWAKRAPFIALPLQKTVADVVETLKEYPPRQRPGSFNLDQVLEQLIEK